MKEKPDNLTPELELLLLNKSFSELTSEESIYVEHYITKSEYVAFRKILLESKRMFKNNRTKVNSVIKEKLLTKIRKPSIRVQNVNSFLALAHYPIPLWKMLMAASLLMFGLYFFGKEKLITSVEPKTVYKYKTDTIYKERIVSVLEKASKKTPPPKTEKRKREQQNTQPSTVVSKSVRSSSVSFSVLTLDSLNLQFGIVDFNEPSLRGRSVKEEGELMDLFVEVN